MRWVRLIPNMEQARRLVESDEVLFSAGAWERRQTMRSTNAALKNHGVIRL